MYTDPILSTVRDCRFCFMCRHVCSVGNVTMRESNTPRGFALIADKSAMDPGVLRDPGFAQTIHECTLCAACRAHCETTHEVPAFIRAARTALHRAGGSPAAVTAVIGAIAASGNPFGERRARWAGLAEPRPGAAVLLYAGAHAAYRVPESATACLAALRRCGIDATVLADEPDSGKVLVNLGAEDAARAAAARLSAAIRATGCTTVVTLCPSDWDALTVDYPALGAALPAEVAVLPSALYYARLISEGRLRPSAGRPLAVIDSDYLCKHHDHGADLRALAAALGGTPVEIGTNREESYAAGEGAMVYELVNPAIARPLFARAAARIAATGTTAVCASPITKANLRSLLPAGGIITIDEAVASAQG